MKGLFTVFAASLLFVSMTAKAIDRGPVPSGFPQTQFFFGVSNSSDRLSWMTGSGASWGARYQYLAGGVNTGSGWQTWGTNFVYNYVKQSADAGYLPVFTYYNIFQSLPHAGSSESAQVWNNLQDPSTMNAFYADLKAVFQQCARDGRRVVLHVEPDLWGFLHQRAGTSDSAAGLSASVASSGFADVAAYPNTVPGFSAAIKKLRDTYGPNVILAYHVNSWGAGDDFASNRSATFDTATHGRRSANFMISTGAANWDVAFLDISNGDAAFYQLNQGDGGAHWWDKTNATVPNFNRMVIWTDAFTATAKKRVVVWQVPVGNTIMRSCDNSWGHFQDNRAEYYLENYPANQNLTALANAGAIGILFGAALDGNTNHFDRIADGTTNPAAINGNNEVAQSSDDDGGYLRTRVANYYRSGAVTLPTNTPVPTPTPTPAPTPTPTPTPTPPPATTNVLYDNAVRNGWMDWSWATHNLNSTAPIYSGTKAISVNYKAWTALSFAHAGFNTGTATTLKFFVHGGTTSGQAIRVQTEFAGGTAGPEVLVGPLCVGGSIKAGQWVSCSMPLSTLGAVNKKVTRINFKEGAGKASLPVMSFDQITIQ